MKAINVTTAATLICPAGYIGQHLLHNASDETIFFAPDGDPAVTVSTGIPIAPGMTFFHEPVSFSPKGPPALYAIHGGTGNKVLRYGNTSFIAT